MKKNMYIILIFCLMFIIGLFNVKNVGVYNDEGSEQEILRMNIREYAELSSLGDDIVLYYDSIGVIPISSSVERDHGISAYYLFSPFLPIGNLSPKILSVLWHLYTYLIFFVGVIALYFIAKKLFFNEKIALLASSMYFLSPRIFADGLYNNKDIVLLTFILCSLYFGLKFIDDKSIKNSILFGVFGAFATNTRIAGIFVFALCGIFYLVYFIKDCIKNKKINIKSLMLGIIAIISMLLVYIIITPSIWGAGKIDLLGHIDWSLHESTKFSRWNGTVLFEGHKYNYVNKDFLPLYYLPKMILITTPIYIILAFFIGIGFLLYEVVCKKHFEQNKYYILIFICLFIPFFFAVATHTKLYNGWRHFYFLYSFIILLSAYGIYKIYSYEKIKKAVYAIIGIGLLFNFLVIIKYGVNNTAYYNLLINHNNIENRYELDYYGVSTKRLLKQAIFNRKSDIVYICYDESNYGLHVLIQNYNSLSIIEKQHLNIVFGEDEYKKLSKEGKEIYLYYNNYKNVYTNKKLDKSKIVYKESCMNDIVSALYQ